jgi:CBS domain-containing protein
MKIDLLYRPGTITAHEGDTLLGAGRLMARHNVSALPVLHHGELSGILTEHDLARALMDRVDPALTQVRRYMTRGPVTVSTDEESNIVARRMLDLGVRHLPVTLGGALVGMISVRDLLLLEAWAPASPASSVPEWAMP